MCSEPQPELGMGSVLNQPLTWHWSANRSSSGSNSVLSPSLRKLLSGRSTAVVIYVYLQTRLVHHLRQALLKNVRLPSYAINVDLELNSVCG